MAAVISAFFTVVIGIFIAAVIAADLFWPNFCFGPTFVLAQLLFWPNFCFGPTFVLAQILFWPHCNCHGSCQFSFLHSCNWNCYCSCNCCCFVLAQLLFWPNF